MVDVSALRERAAELLDSPSVDDAEARLRTLLADEVERCAELLMAGDLCEIHSSILERAHAYRR